MYEDCNQLLAINRYNNHIKMKRKHDAVAYGQRDRHRHIDSERHFTVSFFEFSPLKPDHILHY